MTKPRHPITILMAAGVVITLALLPLYLGQLQSFSSADLESIASKFSQGITYV